MQARLDANRGAAAYPDATVSSESTAATAPPAAAKALETVSAPSRMLIAWRTASLSRPGLSLPAGSRVPAPASSTRRATSLVPWTGTPAPSAASFRLPQLAYGVVRLAERARERTQSAREPEPQVAGSGSLHRDSDGSPEA